MAKIMIFDRLENIGRYKGISETFDRALSLIETADFTAAEQGRTEVCDGVYFTRADIQTTDITDSFFEVHKEYADIFIPLAGEEIVKISDPKGMNLLAEYNPEGDYYAVGGKTDILLTNAPGTFCVCFPEEAHNSAGIPAGQKSETIDKIVVKVRI